MGHTHTAINYALAAFAKATWALGHGRLKPLLSLALGGGQIRHVVKNPTLARLRRRQANRLRRHHRGRPVPRGRRAPASCTTSRRAIALLAVANTEIGAPDFTVNLDGNIGAAYQF